MRIDSNHDNQITFAEFILSDTEYMKEQSKQFYRLDADGLFTAFQCLLEYPQS